jgi:putative RNA 2'-phosphotransferase
MSRLHVHLSTQADQARTVGARHGPPAVLSVDSEAMFRDGHTFYLADNEVWLADGVPAQYLAFHALW